METKKCFKCKIEKDINSFYPRKKVNRMSNCIECVKSDYLSKRPTFDKIKDLEGEIWEDVLEFKDYYQISNFQRVKSLVRKSNLKEKILTVSTHDKGYLVVRINIENKEFVRRVHKLYAIAFIPNPENKPQVNHIDGNKLNNIPSNLEWNTSKENINHAFENGLNHSKISRDRKKSIKRLFKINPNTNVMKLVKKLNVSKNTIYRIKNNQN